MVWDCEFCGIVGTDVRRYFFDADILPYVEEKKKFLVEMIRDLNPLETPKITRACEKCAETHNAHAVECGNCYGLGREQQLYPYPFDSTEVCNKCDGVKVLAFAHSSTERGV